MESANSACRGIIRRTTHIGNVGMAYKHTAAGFMGAEKGFRRIKGYKQMGVLMAMLDEQAAVSARVLIA